MFSFMSTSLRVIIGLVLMLTLYFIPTGIALIRRHNNFIPIFLVNLFLSLLFGIGWIVSLIWSFTSNVKETRSVIEMIKALKDGTLKS